MSAQAQSSIGDRIVLCPQCEHPLPRDVRTCPHCGVDLVLFALLAEKAYLEGVPHSAPLTSTPEALVPRIGEYLLDHDLLSEDKLNAALKRQQELSSQGQHVLLGQTLIQMGFLDRKTLDRAITNQIVELHAALQEANRTLERRVEARTAELRRALERLTDLSQIKANLISNISHELRTPLAHIVGYIELMQEKELGPLTKDQEKALRIMQRASHRLRRLIEDLIEFSTASREGLRLDLQQVDLRELTHDVIVRSMQKADGAGVELVMEIENHLPRVRADRERLSWALFQLVDNGIKFTPDGGQVKVVARQVDQQVSVSIQDTGVGIPEDRFEEIFEPFHQLDASPTRRHGGTGLGLSLVRLILRSHQSELQVVSEVNQGSTFSFELPLAEEA